MIDVRFLVKDVATLKKAKTQSELEGAVAMVLAKIELAETAKAFKPKKHHSAAAFGFREVLHIFREVEKEAGHAEGAVFSVPPFPTPDYPAKIYRSIKSWGMDADYVGKLARKAVTLKPPVALSWVMWNHERILSGAVGWSTKATAQIPAGKAWHGGNTFLSDKLPEG